jgi:hypothetical protein
MKPPPFPFCSVTQQHGGEEGASGRTGRKTGAALSSSAHGSKRNRLQSSPRRYPPPERADSAKHTTKLSLLRHAARFPNGQILPNIPLHSFFCVTLPASRTGRLCQTYHHTLSFALPYPLPERADSAKRTTTLILLRYPTRFPNGQTLSNISPHSFLCVTLPASGTGRLGQKYHHTLSFCVTLPVSRMGRFRQTLPQHSFFCVTLPAARMGRFCKTYHTPFFCVLTFSLVGRQSRYQH